MNPKTEEFLYLLMWSADMLMRPTFSNLNGSFESWAYRNGLGQQLARLEHRRLIERDPGGPDDRLYRLTAAGRLHALGGRDPEERWARPWDGQWRLVLFDVPMNRNAERERLRRYLRGRGFGFVQNSVWITPDPLVEERRLLAEGKINVESLLLLEARPCAGEPDSEIVQGAWDFARINEGYARNQRMLKERPKVPPHHPETARIWLRWAARERAAWLEAVGADPLLPRQILPSDYLGRTVWHERMKVLREAGLGLRVFGAEG